MLVLFTNSRNMKLLIASLIVLIFGTCSLTAQVIIKVKPNRPKVIIVKPSEVRHGHTWVDGHWRFDKPQQKYVWVKGHWKKVKHGHHWAAGHWNTTTAGHIWVEGHWKKQGLAKRRGRGRY
jgi:hypothetical protein